MYSSLKHSWERKNSTCVKYAFENPCAHASGKGYTTKINVFIVDAVMIDDFAVAFALLMVVLFQSLMIVSAFIS